MTWRNRNLFKKKAVPVQKFNMGGSVRGVEALKNVAPTLSTFDYDNAVNMMGGGMVDMPVPQMQMGGDPAIELFESGDSALNEALNTQAAVDTMNQSLMTGGGDAVPQSMMAEPMAEETPMVNEGPRTSSGAEEFTAQALEEAKQSSQDIVAVAMSEIEKEIDTMEEVSVDEMKNLAEVIVRQQQRLDNAASELTKAMGLGEQPDITLFDNEFEREIEKKYPLVAAALAKTLPNIMDTDKLVAADMPSEDTPVLQMEPGGAVPQSRASEYLQSQIEAQQKIIDDLNTTLKTLRDKEEKSSGNQRRNIRADITTKEQELAVAQAKLVELQGYLSPSEDSTPPQSGKEYVEQDIAGRVMGNRRTFEDVVEQPAVQQIFSDLDDMVKKMGFGNIKDTKVTGSGAMTQAIRQKLKGEAAGDAIKLQAKTKLLGDIEGDPFNTKSGALTTAKLNQLLEGDLTSDAAFEQSKMAPYDWLASGQQLPRRIRNRIGVANSYVSKVIGGTSMNFMDLFDMATSDPQVSAYINGISSNDEKSLQKRKLIDILVDAWNKGQFNIRQVYKGLGIVQEANQ
tara:strand:- start:879 stop:2582 length:1704 start_codon:yes stop_codon:yes gene_type:complete